MLFLAAAAGAETWQGTCAGVLDGDSLVITRDNTGKEVRLYGIDAPEYDQDYGRQARDYLRRLVLNEQVRVEPVDIDSYGRTVARVHAPGGCVNEQLIARGCAWLYTRYCAPEDRHAWQPLEENARQQRLGLWAQDEPIPPWEFRHAKADGKSARSAPSAPPAGHYRGNTGSRVFHAPECRYYACKHCTAGFNSIGEAMRAGYRPCRNCIDN